MKSYNIVLGVAFMIAAFLASSCQKADILDNSADPFTKLDENSILVYTSFPDLSFRQEAIYDETRTVIYFDGKNAGKIKKAFYDAGIRMSVIMGREGQLSTDLKNFDEVIDYDELVFASVGTSVENAYTFPGVEYATPFLRYTINGAQVPTTRYVYVSITSPERLEELTKMVDEYGLGFYSVPENGIGEYIVMCNRHSKVYSFLFGNALIESKLFSSVYYCVSWVRMCDALTPNDFPDHVDRMWDATSPFSFFLDCEDALLKEYYGDLDGLFDYYNIH